MALVQIPLSQSPAALSMASYRFLPMAELFRLIAEKRDAFALHELHENRTITRTAGGKDLRPVEYLSSLVDRYQSILGDHALRAYDLTLDKFWNLPEATGDGHGDGGKDGKGSDCTHYFQACLHKLSQILDKHPGMDESQKEALAASVLRNFLTRHFSFSIRESLRERCRFVSRYYWKVNGETLCLQFPRTVPGGARHSWLDANAPDTDPSRPGERQRVQDLINRHFETGRFVGEEYAESQLANPYVSAPGREQSVPNGSPKQDLAEKVAEEKATIAHRLRPAIRTLGQGKIRALVLRIFTDLELDEYSAEQVAKDFGLAKPALSRFAGTVWARKTNDGDEDVRVPDLWVNLSGVLARDETFRELARSAGVWERAARITKARVFKGRTRRGAP